MSKKIILTDDITAARKLREEKFKGLHELVEFIIARIEGRVGDILLTHEQRIAGLIEDFVHTVEERGIRKEDYKILEEN